MDSRRRRWIAVGIGATVALVALAFVPVVMGMVRRNQQKTECVNHQRNLMDLLFAELAVDRREPPAAGKRWVLSLGADPRLLFCPGDTKYRLETVDASAYRASSAGEVRHLTSYAGPRRGADCPRGPLLSDDDDGPPHHADGMVMAFPDRSIRVVEWEELGLPPERRADPGPLFGETAGHDLLRCLSSE